MLEKELFKYIDYALHGTTYDNGGLIEIEIELYTPEAVRLRQELMLLKVSLSEKNLSSSVLQLLAEEPYYIYFGDSDRIKAELDALDKEPWQPIDAFNTYDAKLHRPKKQLMYYTNKKHPAPQRIITSLTLDRDFAKNHRELLPLFRHVCKLIVLTSQDILSIKYGLYTNGISYKAQQVNAELTRDRSNPYQISARVAADAQRDALSVLQASGAFERLASWLRSVSYADAPFGAPDTQENYEDTGLYIGSKGWQLLATEENIVKLITHTALSVQVGRDKTSLPLSTK